MYLDHHATTPVDRRVLEAMDPFWRGSFGNPASRHAAGRAAAAAVEAARADVAALLGARPEEIVFTSGATESINLAMKGLAARREGRIVVSAADHPAVLETAARLAAAGREVVELPVDGHGRVDPAALERALERPAAVVAVLWASNEIGTIERIGTLARIARERGVPFMSDATQAVGKIPVDVESAGVDLLPLSAHKFYGPKGVGALYVRRGLRIDPLVDGGGHERGLRSGTPNVPGIVGFGAACRIARAEMADEARRVGALRDRLRARLLEAIDRVVENGDPDRRLPGNLNVSFEFVEAEELLARLPEIEVSSGAACASAKRRPSHVLEAIGRSRPLIEASIRFGLGRWTTEAEVDEAARRFAEEVSFLRRRSALYAAASVG